MNPMAQYIYVVRIWREPTADGAGSWRASVSDAQSREKRFFASPRTLAAYLGLEPDALEAEAPQNPP